MHETSERGHFRVGAVTGAQRLRSGYATWQHDNTCLSHSPVGVDSS